jgi:integrin beta 8
MGKFKVLIIAMLALLLVGCPGLFGPKPGTPDNPDPGIIAARLLTGDGLPAPTLGNNGDLYLDQTLSILWVKNAGAWIKVADLRGPPGEAGKTWLTGDTPPDSNAGSIGDLYLDTTTAIIYKKSSGGWNIIAELALQTGFVGSTWLTGGDIPDDEMGSIGDLYLAESTSTIYKKTSEGWVFVASLTGPPGVVGAPGTPGVPGATWLSGTADPATNVGNDGDFYLNTSTTAVFQKLADGWIELMTLLGPAGSPGSSGQDGLDGSAWFTGNIPPDPNQGRDGDFYLDLSTVSLYNKTGGSWSTAIPLRGPQGEIGPAGINGANGTVWFAESGNPNEAPVFAGGKIGDFYLNTANGDVYINNGSWPATAALNLRGPAGANGATWYYGAVAPSGVTPGVSGDFYLNTANGNVYINNGSWPVMAALNLRGPAGADGIDGTNGTNGADGADGATWYYGTVAPTGATGTSGDFYLNTANGDVYINNGSWPLTAALNLRGPIGETGAAGTNGATWYYGTIAPTGTPGVSGDFYLNTANGDVYINNGSWPATVALNLRGPIGETGAAGTNGATWYYGTVAPTGATGTSGDFYLNTANGDVYINNGSWPLTAALNLRGPIGETGAAGTNGATWYYGTIAPTGTPGVSGDFYLNTANGDVYINNGSWPATVALNLRGPIGETGAAGATWFTGSGTPAVAGVTGVDGDLYLDTATADVYKKVAGSWTKIANLRGTMDSGVGIAEITLPDPIVVPAFALRGDFYGRITPGEYWHFGNGEPESSGGFESYDVYLDLDTGDLWILEENEGLAWEWYDNINNQLVESEILQEAGLYQLQPGCCGFGLSGFPALFAVDPISGATQYS